MLQKISSERKKYNNDDVTEIINKYGPLIEKIKLTEKQPVALYGAGFVGTWALTYLQNLGCDVKCFIDKDENKVGQKIQGIPIVSASDNKGLESITTIFIAARHYVNDVLEFYADAKQNVISFDAFFVVKNYTKLSHVRDQLLIDQTSVSTFNAILLAMLSGNLKTCYDVMEKDMYFSLPQFSGNFAETFVDAGAFVGDTVERFIWENLGTFKHIYAFEPGIKQYRALSKRVNRLAEEWAFDLKSVTLEQMGLSATSDKMQCIYTNDHPLRHALSKEGGAIIEEGNEEQQCQVVSLDHYLDGKAVSFIKVDIEGMEMDFLRGAEQTIRRFRPKMALCAYHYPSDLYEIAEYVHQLVPEYKFSLRLHAPIFGDYVLYCYLEE